MRSIVGAGATLVCAVAIAEARAAPVEPRVPSAAARFPMGSQPQGTYWRAKGPPPDALAEPVEAGIDADGWAWFAYEAPAADVVAAWQASVNGDVVHRTADGRSWWVDQGGARAGLRVDERGGRVVVSARCFFQEWPASMPADPFCPGALRPDFRYDGAEVTQRACRDPATGRPAGPLERTLGAGTLIASRSAGHALDGEVTAREGAVVVASGRFVDGRPDGPWTGLAPSRWVDGRPTPASLDGVLDHSRGLVASDHTFEVLDFDLAGGRVAWRARTEGSHELEEPCRYPGLADGQGVTLGLASLDSGRGEAWAVYEAAGSPSCTPDDVATSRLAAAKAAWAGAGLDHRRLPAPAPSSGDAWDVRFDLGDGHVLRVTTTEDVPPLAEQFAPSLLRGAPYEPHSSADGHTYFSTVTLDGRRVWTATAYLHPNCAGGGDVSWPAAWRQGDRVVVLWSKLQTSCDGALRTSGFSPVFTLK